MSVGRSQDENIRKITKVTETEN